MTKVMQATGDTVPNKNAKVSGLDGRHHGGFVELHGAELMALGLPGILAYAREWEQHQPPKPLPEWPADKPKPPHIYHRELDGSLRQVL